MLKGRELMGLPVINRLTGQEIGMAEDLYLKLKEKKVTGLSVRSGNWLTSCQVVPLENVYQVGTDAVLINPMEEDNPPQEKELPYPSEDNTCGVKELKGLPVISTGGNDLGTVEDVLLNLPEGKILGWELSDGLVQDLVDGRKFLPGGSVLLYGPDRFIVQEGGWQG